MAESEQERALAFRNEQQAREENRLAREQAMAGQPDRFIALEVAWSAVRRWAGWDPQRRVKGEPE